MRGCTVPQAELDMFRCGSKVVVGAQKHQIVPQTELNQHCVDRSDLDTVPAAGVAYFCSFDVVLAIWLQKREGGESLNQLGSRLRSSEPLQQFLEDQAGREHLVCAL